MIFVFRCFVLRKPTKLRLKFGTTNYNDDPRRSCANDSLSKIKALEVESEIKYSEFEEKVYKVSIEFILGEVNQSWTYNIFTYYFDLDLPDDQESRVNNAVLTKLKVTSSIEEVQKASVFVKSHKSMLSKSICVDYSKWWALTMCQYRLQAVLIWEKWGFSHFERIQSCSGVEK